MAYELRSQEPRARVRRRRGAAGRRSAGDDGRRRRQTASEQKGGGHDSDDGASQAPPSGPEKEEQRELFWQEVEKTLFGPVPKLLSSAIDTHIEMGEKYVSLLDRSQLSARTVAASDIFRKFRRRKPGGWRRRREPGEENQLWSRSDFNPAFRREAIKYEESGLVGHISEKPVARKDNNAEVQTASVVIHADNDNAFYGPWQFQAMHHKISEFFDMFSQLADIDKMRYGALDKEVGYTGGGGGQAASFVLHRPSVDVYISTLLGLKLEDDNIRADVVRRMQALISSVTGNNDDVAQFSRLKKEHESSRSASFNPVDSLLLPYPYPSGKDGSPPTSTVNVYGSYPPEGSGQALVDGWDSAADPVLPSSDIGQEAALAKQSSFCRGRGSESRGKRRSDALEAARGLGRYHAARVLFHLPAPLFKLSSYSPAFVEDLKGVRDWVHFLHVLLRHHESSMCSVIKLNAALVDSRVTLGGHGNESCHGCVVPLPAAMIGPQGLFRATKLVEGRPRISWSEEEAGSFQRPFGAESKKLELSDLWSPLSRGDSGIEDQLWFQQDESGGEKIITLLEDSFRLRKLLLSHPSIFKRSVEEKSKGLTRIRLLDAPSSSSSEEDSDESAGSDADDTESEGLPTTLPRSHHPSLNNKGSFPAAGELLTEYTYLTTYLRDVVVSKCKLLRRLRQRMLDERQRDIAYWTEVEQRMLELFKRDFFLQSLSGRHSYTLARQWRDLMIVRMTCQNGNLLPSWWTEQALCSICGGGVGCDDDPILFCDACFVPAHHACVGSPPLNPPKRPELASAPRGAGSSGGRKETASSHPRVTAAAYTQSQRRPSQASLVKDELEETPSLLDSNSRLTETTGSEAASEDYTDEYHESSGPPPLRTSTPPAGKGRESRRTLPPKLHNMDEKGNMYNTERTSRNKEGPLGGTTTSGGVEVSAGEWFCECCELVIDQLEGDVTKAIPVVRHLAGPRTVREFKDLLTHEQAVNFPPAFIWYFPSPYDSGNELVNYNNVAQRKAPLYNGGRISVVKSFSKDVQGSPLVHRDPEQVTQKRERSRKPKARAGPRRDGDATANVSSDDDEPLRGGLSCSQPEGIAKREESLENSFSTHKRAEMSRELKGCAEFGSAPEAGLASSINATVDEAKGSSDMCKGDSAALSESNGERPKVVPHFQHREVMALSLMDPALLHLNGAVAAQRHYFSLIHSRVPGPWLYWKVSVLEAELQSTHNAVNSTLSSVRAPRNPRRNGERMASALGNPSQGLKSEGVSCRKPTTSDRRPATSRRLHEKEGDEDEDDYNSVDQDDNALDDDRSTDSRSRANSGRFGDDDNAEEDIPLKEDDDLAVVPRRRPRRSVVMMSEEMQLSSPYATPPIETGAVGASNKRGRPAKVEGASPMKKRRTTGAPAGRQSPEDSPSLTGAPESDLTSVQRQRGESSPSKGAASARRGGGRRKGDDVRKWGPQGSADGVTTGEDEPGAMSGSEHLIGQSPGVVSRRARQFKESQPSESDAPKASGERGADEGAPLLGHIPGSGTTPPSILREFRVTGFNPVFYVGDFQYKDAAASAESLSGYGTVDLDKEDAVVQNFNVRVPVCAICGYDAYYRGGGPVKKTFTLKKRKEYAHIRCILGADCGWSLDASRCPSDLEKSKLRCQFCNQIGPTIAQCAHSGCIKPYHLPCATQFKECVTEFPNGRPAILCWQHGKEKAPTQMLRQYQAALDKQRRVRRRGDEELSTVAGCSSSSGNGKSQTDVNSAWLRSCLSAQGVSAISLDFLYPTSLVKVAPGALLDAQSASNKNSQFSSSPARSPVSLASPDSPDSDYAPSSMRVKRDSEKNQSFHIKIPRRSWGLIDELLWAAAGLSHGHLSVNVTQDPSAMARLSSSGSAGPARGMSFTVGGSGQSQSPTPSNSLIITPVTGGSGISKSKAWMLMQDDPNVTNAYELYLARVGAFGPYNVLDCAVRLYVFLKCSTLTPYELDALDKAAFSIASSWVKHRLPWIENANSSSDGSGTEANPLALTSSIPLAASPLSLFPFRSSALTTRASGNRRGGDRAAAPSVYLSPTASGDGSSLELFDQWICCACGVEGTLAVVSSNSSKFSGGGLNSSLSMSVRGEERGSAGSLTPNIVRCRLCGCCVCSSCCKVYCRPVDFSGRKGSRGSLGKSVDQGSGVPAEDWTCPRCTYFFEEGEGDFHEMSEAARTAVCYSSCLLCNRLDGLLVKRLGVNDSLSTPGRQTSEGSSAARRSPNSNQGGGDDGFDGAMMMDGGSESHHGSRSGSRQQRSPSMRYPYSTSSGGGRLHQGGEFGEHHIPSSSPQISPQWVHPFCAEWFVPPKLRGNGIGHVGKILKKYGSRSCGWGAPAGQGATGMRGGVASMLPHANDDIVTGVGRSGAPATTAAQSAANSVRSTLATSCCFCGFTTGALCSCSNPKCPKCFHISCARLWGCKLDLTRRLPYQSQAQRQQAAAAATSHGGSNGGALSVVPTGASAGTAATSITRRAYCRDHSVSLSVWTSESDFLAWLTQAAVISSCWSSALNKSCWNQMVAGIGPSGHASSLSGSGPIFSSPSKGPSFDLSLQLVTTFISALGCLPLVFTTGMPSRQSTFWEITKGAVGRINARQRKALLDITAAGSKSLMPSSPKNLHHSSQMSLLAQLHNQISKLPRQISLPPLKLESGAYDDRGRWRPSRPALNNEGAAWINDVMGPSTMQPWGYEGEGDRISVETEPVSPPVRRPEIETAMAEREAWIRENCKKVLGIDPVTAGIGGTSAAVNAPLMVSPSNRTRSKLEECSVADSVANRRGKRDRYGRLTSGLGGRGVEGGLPLSPTSEQSFGNVVGQAGGQAYPASMLASGYGGVSPSGLPYGDFHPGQICTKGPDGLPLPPHPLSYTADGFPIPPRDANGAGPPATATPSGPAMPRRRRRRGDNEPPRRRGRPPKAATLAASMGAASAAAAAAAAAGARPPHEYMKHGSLPESASAHRPPPEGLSHHPYGASPYPDTSQPHWMEGGGIMMVPPQQGDRSAVPVTHHQHNPVVSAATEQMAGAAVPPLQEELPHDYSCGICGCVYGPHDLYDWIGCDGCDTWYHWFCQGINYMNKPREDARWYCSRCRESSNLVKAPGMVVARAMARRPEMRV